MRDTEITYVEAIRQALFEEMRRDETVFCIGEDIGKFGGAFKITKGLLEEFGADRVIDTPISEAGVVGMAIGAALSGMRPVVEMQFADFVTNAFTQLVFNAAKSNYRWGHAVPLVVRLPSGGGLSAGPFHSTNPEAWFCHVPGLKVVAPAFANDARGLLKSSIRDNNPVIYLEHKYLYRRQKQVITSNEDIVEIGKAKVAREGSDVSVVSYGVCVQYALDAAQNLEAEGVSVEIIDLRSLVPWDKNLVMESVQKTGRVLVVHEATHTCGFGAEVASTIGEAAFSYLDAPVMRLTAPDVPVPFAPPLEEAFIPNTPKIASSLRSLLRY